jgi:hypothetical protein
MTKGEIRALSHAPSCAMLMYRYPASIHTRDMKTCLLRAQDIQDAYSICNGGTLARRAIACCGPSPGIASIC